LRTHLCVGNTSLIFATLLLVATLLLPTKLNINSEIKLDDRFIKQFNCLATALYFEARGENHLGIVGVANVIINRTEHRKFPGDVCGVVKQRTKYVCQFSWVCDGAKININRIPVKYKEIAKKALSGTLKDVTGGALFFHSMETNPWKNLTHTRTIGRHNFYKY
jgi:spore germination cell wall hydrolase CwlJ-like protein